jgi:hypothetical protein
MRVYMKLAMIVELESIPPLPPSAFVVCSGTALAFNRVRVVNFAPSKNLVFKSTMLQHCILRSTNLICNKEELPYQWKEINCCTYTKRVIRLIVVIIEAYHCCQLHRKFYPTLFSLGQVLMQMKLLGIINVDFD